MIISPLGTRRPKNKFGVGITSLARPDAWAGSVPGTIFVGMIVVLASLLGFLVSVMPWYLPIGLVLLPAALAFTLARPYLGLFLALAMLFEVIPAAVQPRLPIGGGNLRLYDVFIIILLISVTFRRNLSRSRSSNVLGPMLFPMIYLTFSFSVALIYGKFIVHNPDWLSEGRAAIAWALLPLIVMTCDTNRRFRTFLTGIVIIGLIIALFVSIQSVFGVRIMTEARVEMLDAAYNSDVTRSIADGGIYIVIFSLYFILNLFIDRRFHWFPTILFSALLILGIAVQFGRGVWIATALGMLVSSFIHRGFSGLIRTVIFGTVALAVLLSALAIVKPRMAEALIERATGISREIESGGSFDWRRRENAAAIDSIERHPLLGVGIGGDYKQTVSSTGSFGIETRYIHNAYLYFPLKMGLYASFIPFSFVLCFFIVLRRGLRPGTKPSDRCLAAALSGAFIVPVLTSFTQPEWVAPRGIAALCIFMALILLFLREHNEQNTARDIAERTKA